VTILTKVATTLLMILCAVQTAIETGDAAKVRMVVLMQQMSGHKAKWESDQVMAKLESDPDSLEAQKLMEALIRKQVGNCHFSNCHLCNRCLCNSAGSVYALHRACSLCSGLLPHACMYVHVLHTVVQATGSIESETSGTDMCDAPTLLLLLDAVVVVLMHCTSSLPQRFHHPPVLAVAFRAAACIDLQS
jgi:hypothetical protein